MAKWEYEEAFLGLGDSIMEVIRARGEAGWRLVVIVRYTSEEGLAIFEREMTDMGKQPAYLPADHETEATRMKMALNAIVIEASSVTVTFMADGGYVIDAAEVSRTLDRILRRALEAMKGAP